jgi:hypothetical protein
MDKSNKSRIQIFLLPKFISDIRFSIVVSLILFFTFISEIVAQKHSYKAESADTLTTRFSSSLQTRCCP